MTVFRYPTRNLIADYGRAGLGLAAAGGPLALVDGMVPALTVVFAAATTAFALYGLRTVMRHSTRLVVDDGGVTLISAATGRDKGRRVTWERLDRLRLAYFAPRRRGGDRMGGRWHDHGWLQLSLGGGGQRLKIDSTLDRFTEFLDLALAKARDRGVKIDQTTRANLDALGLDNISELT